MSEKDYILKFGMHKDKRLEDVPLLYLDWLIGLNTLYPDTKRTIEKYLDDPAIQKELEIELAKVDTDDFW